MLLGAGRVLARRLGKALKRLAGVVGELGGDIDHDTGNEPAAAADAQAGHAVAVHHKGLAVLRARGYIELEMLIGQDALNIDRAAQRRLGDTDVDLAQQVVPVALEALVGLDLDGHDEVAGAGAAEARLAVAAQTQLAAGAHARRNLDVQALMGADAAVAVAVRAGLVDDGALALAIGAR